jgi:hypothetical protein
VCSWQYKFGDIHPGRSCRVRVNASEGGSVTDGKLYYALLTIVFIIIIFVILIVISVIIITTIVGIIIMK